MHGFWIYRDSSGCGPALPERSTCLYSTIIHNRTVGFGYSMRQCVRSSLVKKKEALDMFRAIMTQAVGSATLYESVSQNTPRPKSHHQTLTYRDSSPTQPQAQLERSISTPTLSAIPTRLLSIHLHQYTYPSPKSASALSKAWTTLISVKRIRISIIIQS